EKRDLRPRAVGDRIELHEDSRQLRILRSQRGQRVSSPPLRMAISAFRSCPAAEQKERDDQGNDGQCFHPSCEIPKRNVFIRGHLPYLRLPIAYAFVRVVARGARPAPTYVV